MIIFRLSWLCLFPHLNFLSLFWFGFNGLYLLAVLVNILDYVVIDFGNQLGDNLTWKILLYVLPNLSCLFWLLYNYKGNQKINQFTKKDVIKVLEIYIFSAWVKHQIFKILFFEKKKIRLLLYPFAFIFHDQDDLSVLNFFLKKKH